MMLSRILPAAIGGVIAIPIILLNLSAIGSWASFEESMGDEASSAVPPVLGGLGKSLNSLWGGHVASNERAAIFDAERLTKKRVVTYRRSISLDMVLEPGETPPHPDFHDLFILARAPTLSTERCPEMLAKFATACAVGRISISEGRNSPPVLSTTYGYLPGYDFGDTSNIDKAELEREFVDLVDRKGNERIREGDLPALRAAIYDLAIQECASLRADKGSCMITDLRITEIADAKRPGFYRVHAKSVMKWLKGPEHAGPGMAAMRDGSSRHSVADDATVAGFFTKVASTVKDTVTGSASASKPAPDKPVVRNGGNAFRSAGSAKFQKVDPG